MNVAAVWQHAHHGPDAFEPLGITSTTFDALTVAMVAAALLLAVLVYTLMGVGVLRRAWINLDWIWAGVLVFTGAVTLLMGVVQLAGVGW